MEKPSIKIPRIALIGPLSPYRGGIAQHTTMLHRVLRSRSTLLTLSFKRLYPKHLYPGRADLEPGYEKTFEPEVFYILDSMNPFTWQRACRLLLDHSPDLVIIPWWTVFLSLCFGFMARYLRKRGIVVLFICHNVIDHESGFWKGRAARAVLSIGNAFLLHSKEEMRKLKTFIPKARTVFHPHPVFHQFPTAKGSLHRRSKLELLFFGFVRPYKGLDILLKAMKLLKNEDVFLTVAGEWWEKDGTLRELIKERDINARVELVDRYISEGETAEYFSRADIVVLPYRSATGTGVIPLAYHYGKPVIASNVGGFPDVVEDGVSGRLVQPDDPDVLADVIRGFLREPPVNMRQGVEKVAEPMTWESLGNIILESADVPHRKMSSVT